MARMLCTNGGQQEIPRVFRLFAGCSRLDNSLVQTNDTPQAHGVANKLQSESLSSHRTLLVRDHYAGPVGYRMKP